MEAARKYDKEFLNNYSLSSEALDYNNEIDFESHKQEKNTREGAKVFAIKSLILMIILAVSIGTLISLIPQSRNAKISNEVARLQNRKAELEKRKMDLTAELETIKSSGHILEEAIYKLGMSTPKEEQVIFINIVSESSEDKNLLKKDGKIKRIVNIIANLF